MKLESLAANISKEPLSIDAALHLFLRMIIELEALHTSGRYAGDISLSTVLCGVDRSNVKFKTRPRAQVVDSLDSAQIKDLKDLGLVMFAVLNGNASNETAANSGSADLYLPIEVPVWLSILVRRMIRGDQALSISEIRRVVLRNLNVQSDKSQLVSWPANSSVTKPSSGNLSRVSVANLLHSTDGRNKKSLLLTVLPHLTLLTIGILVGFTGTEWHIASLAVMVPFFLVMSLLGFFPLLILKSVDGDIPHAISHWLRGSFYLSIWMLITFLFTIMYIDIAGANDNWPNTVTLGSATWASGAVVSVESVIHGVVLAPTAPAISLTENLISGGVSHGSSGKSLIACYVIFVLGFLSLGLYYAEPKLEIENLISRIWWVFGVLALEILFILLFENTISLLPVSISFELVATELHLRAVSLVFGLANTVIFWSYLLSADRDFTSPDYSRFVPPQRLRY